MESYNYVVHDIERTPKELVQAMSKLATPTICEAYGGKGALAHYIRPIRLGMKLCGPVVPVVSHSGDNIIVHEAIYVAKPGDILLVSTSSCLEGGFWGAIMTVAAQQRGIRGLVTDGAVRDTDEMHQMGFPVFSQAVSMKGTTKAYLGTINHPIFFGDVKVDPGDLIVGDSDGVVVVARKDVASVLELANKREEKENKIIAEMKQGKTTLELYGFADKLKQLGLKE